MLFPDLNEAKQNFKACIQVLIVILFSDRVVYVTVRTPFECGIHQKQTKGKEARCNRFGSLFL